ncbi:MAG: hypothetical protein R3A79_02390 [Nannocystaceae bacterium]
MDGYGDPDDCMPGTPGEDPPGGYVEGGEDCNDDDPDTFPAPPRRTTPRRA